MTGIENAAQGSLFGRVDQVGIVVRNADDSVKEYEKYFGEGSFAVFEGEQPAILGDGREIMIKGRLAFAQLGDVQVELIQILEGPSIHVDFLEQNGEGIHHVGIYTPTFDKDLEGFQNKGIGILQQGTGIRRYAYMDTKPFILELIEAD